MTRLLLDIEPREQWENENGFCGETSLQSIGLYYGCWMSQQFIRTINGGEFLITNDENDERTLTKLLFDFERWQFESENEPQYERYCTWLKQHLIQRHPCIIAVYIADVDDKSEAYDHIMPAVGIQYNAAETTYDQNDKLLFYNLFDLKLIERELNTHDMIKTRNRCKDTADTGGCLPKHVNYGYAILGVKDEQKVTMPVRLQVNSTNEPNLSLGAAPIFMQGTIIVYDLEVNKCYALLRYNSFTEVPWSGDAQAFLNSTYYKRHDFRATSNTYSYTDPEEIPSSGSTYYRCVLA